MSPNPLFGCHSFPSPYVFNTLQITICLVITMSFPMQKKLNPFLKCWLKPLDEGITKCNTFFNSHFREGLYFNNLLVLRFYPTQNALKNHVECIKTKCIFLGFVLLKTLCCKRFTYI